MKSTGEYEILPPDAMLMASMRAIGYSFKTAVADLIDNSLAAKARNVSLVLDSSESPFFYVLDDGHGMSKDDLRTAMKLAGRSVYAPRSSTDLGRFGLGLKTASLSQAKTLTVATFDAGNLIAANWDIDRVIASGEWSLKWLSPEEIDRVPGSQELFAQGKGTLVTWQNLDVFFDDVADRARHAASSLEELSRHLSLVFHRFMSGPRKRLDLILNGRTLSPFDPFLETDAMGVQIQPSQTIQIGNSAVSVRPFILPPISKMSAKQRKLAIFEEPARESQGFYIYRSERLLAWGSWYRLLGLSETSKLARIKVDTSTELDSLWKLGIMKSEVSPPPSLIKALRTLVPKFVEKAVEVSVGKSKIVISSEDSAWTVRESGDRTFRIEINRQNVLVRTFEETLDRHQLRQLGAVFSYLEKFFPAQALHHRLANDDAIEDITVSQKNLETYFNQLSEAFFTANLGHEEFFEMLSKVDPFASSSVAKAFLDEKKLAGKAYENSFGTGAK
jgi:hypothetical protein